MNANLSTGAIDKHVRYFLEASLEPGSGQIEVEAVTTQAESAIRSLSQASNQDEMAFAALVLLKQRKA